MAKNMMCPVCGHRVEGRLVTPLVVRWHCDECDLAGVVIGVPTFAPASEWLTAERVADADLVEIVRLDRRKMKAGSR